MATLVQSTPVAGGSYADAVAAFPSPVTTGNTIVVLGSNEDGTITMASNQGDSFTLHSAAVTAYMGAFIARAVAVGGSTTLTMSGCVTNRFVAQEWSGLTFDSAAGVGTAAGTAAVSPATPNASSVASSVSFSSWAQIEWSSANDQIVAAGFTEIGRPDPGEAARFVAGYRVETVTGVKTAAWADDGSTGQSRAALILVFSDAGGGSGVIESTAGSADGVATVSAVSAAIKSSTLTASDGAASTAGVGSAIKASTGAAAVGVATTAGVGSSVVASVAQASDGIATTAAGGASTASSTAGAADGLATASATSGQIIAVTAIEAAGTSTAQAETGTDPESTAQTAEGSSTTAAVGAQVLASDPVSADGIASTDGQGGSTSSSTAEESAGIATAIAVGSSISSAVAVTAQGVGTGEVGITSGDIAESEALTAECVATCSAIAQAIAVSEIVVAAGSCYTAATTERREASTWIAATAGQVWQAQGEPGAFEWVPSTTPQTQVTWN